MDKLKLILDFLKKYVFWFIFAGTIILVLVCWWMSTASLAKSFQQEQVKIKKKFDEVKAIEDDKQHPTQDFIKAVNEKNQKMKEGVLEVWETLYNAQKEENPWPEVLGKEFKNLDPNKEIREDLREKYQNYIKGYFPSLFKIIDMRHPPETGEAGGGAEVMPHPPLYASYLGPAPNPDAGPRRLLWIIPIGSARSIGMRRIGSDWRIVSIGQRGRTRT